MTRNELTAEYGRLIDEKFLGQWNESKAARLALVSSQLDTLDSARTSALRQDLTDFEQKLDAIEARIAKSGPNSPQSKSAGAK